jgi:uncharacterized protein (TIGR03435 family)
MGGVRITAVLLLAAAAVPVPLVHGQAAQAHQNAARPVFEVATIKQSPSLDGGGTIFTPPGGQLRAINIDARSLITFAFRGNQRLFNSQIVNAPTWLESERFDITAKSSEALAAAPDAELSRAMPQLVQSLLEDRFKLKLHRETRQLQRYVLSVARKDGSLGPRLRPVSRDCAVDRTLYRIQMTPGHLAAGAMSVSNLVAFLGGNVERVIVDQSGLTGTFDIELDWSPEQAATDQPSLFSAIQEQLGLKLEPTKGPVEVLVIDHVEKPAPD